MITSRYNGAAELMTHEREGFVLAEPADHIALADAMARLTDAVLRGRMAEAARELAVQASNGPQRIKDRRGLPRNGAPPHARRATRLTAEKILVTGAGGFIGSHLAEHLVHQGHQVRAFIHYNSAGRRGWLDSSPCASAIEFVSGDIRDFDAVHRATEICSTIFHLAALVGIPYSYVSPHAYLRTNIDGGYNVLESARLRGVQKVVITSTSEIYGTAQRCPMDETHPVNCQSPYAASKAAADHLALSYHRSFALPVTIVRPFNTYGPRQSTRALIPTVVTQILANRDAIELGNLYPERDFTFVEDVVRGFASAAQGEFDGDCVHLGSGESIAVGDLANLIARLMGRSISIAQERERSRPDTSEVDRLVCDNTKIRSRTGWQPAIKLDEGLNRTIAWIEAHQSGYRADEYGV